MYESSHGSSKSAQMCVLVWTLLAQSCGKYQNLVGWLIHKSTHRLEKYFNLEGFLEKSLKIRYALKSTGKSCEGLEKSLNSTFCRN